MRKLFPALFSVVALLALAPAALASTASSSSGNVTYSDAAAANNDVFLTQPDATTLEISDSAGITAGTNCTQVDPNTVDCTTAAGKTETFDLGDGFDSLDGSSVTGDNIVASGGPGSDGIMTGDGADTLNGGSGSDSLQGGAGADTLNGDAGSDNLDGGAGNDAENGGDDNDYFGQNGGTAQDGADTIDGGNGVDQMDYSERTSGVTADLASGTNNSGGSGEMDTLLNIENANGSFSGPNTLTGNASPNSLYGGSDVDTINGGDGNDTMFGDQGNDTLNGGPGNDDVEGGSGTDMLDGGDGNDYVYGDEGADTLTGGLGDDELDPGGNIADGADVMDGGDGSDFVDYYRAAAVTIDMSSEGGAPTTNNGEANEHDTIVNVESANDYGSGNDTVIGNALANIVYGGNGQDNVQTGAGNDFVYERDNKVDTVDCGPDGDTVYADVAGQFTSTVSDVVSNCEAVNQDFVPPVVTNTNTGTGTNTTPVTTPVTTPIVIPPVQNGVFFAKTQFSPKRDTVTGTVTVASDNSTVTALLLYAGKIAKVTVVGKTVKTGVKKGGLLITVKLNKKAAKALKKKKTVAVTLKVTIKPPTGTAFVKSQKLTMKKGKAPACLRAAARAHAAC